MISSSRSTACGFSILAMTPARPRAILRTSTRSSGRCTKESATQSTLGGEHRHRGRRGPSRSARRPAAAVSGRLTPFLSEILVPETTVVTMRLPSLFQRLQLQLAVVDQQAVAGLDRIQDFGMRQIDAVAVAGRLGLLSSVKVWPRRQLDLAVGELADAQLRSLQVGENADRPAAARPRRRGCAGQACASGRGWRGSC